MKFSEPSLVCKASQLFSRCLMSLMTAALYCSLFQLLARLMCDAPPRLLGRIRNGLKACETTKAAAADEEAPGSQAPASRQSREGQTTWLHRCCWCSTALLVVTFTTYSCAANRFVFRYFPDDAGSWALAATTAVAGWAAFWLWLIAPTEHILLAARFLLFNWLGGLFSLSAGSRGRQGPLILELLGLQYLAQDRLKSLWPALGSPRWGIWLGRAFWIEAGLLCLSITLLWALQYQDLSSTQIVASVGLFFASFGIICFIIWVLGVTDIFCRVTLILHRTLKIAQEEANLTAVEALLASRRNAFLQGIGIIASLATSIIVLAAALSHSYGHGFHFYLAAQCISSIVNVAVVVFLSNAYELLRWRGSAPPPPVSWIRCCFLCQRCPRSSRKQQDRPGTRSEWELKTEELASRGISLSDLLGFYQKLGDSIMMSFQPAVHTTNDVVRLGIIPRTSATCSSYAELVNNGKKVIPKKMVTHNWSNLFRDLMATVIADALGEHTFEFVAALLSDKEGVKVLGEVLRSQGSLDATYWICAFAVNQHAGICGANPNGDIDPVTQIPHPTCPCNTPKFFNKDPPLNENGESIQCEMNKFDDMMAFLSKNDPTFTEVVAVDADLNLFRRAWCIAELAEAHRMGMAQNLVLKNEATLLTRQGTLQGLQVENMRASRPEDVQQILAKIPDKKAFNEKLQKLIFDGQIGLLAAWKKADVLQQMDDLSHVLKWARLSEIVQDGSLIWRRWIVSAHQTI